MSGWLVFTVDSTGFAVELAKIEGVVNAIALASGNNKNHPGMGVINVHGDLIPVFDLRVIMGFKQKEIEVSDQFIIVKENSKIFALIINNALEVIEYAKEDIKTIPHQGSFNFCDFALQHNDNIVPILNITELQKSCIP